jgi:hypothetical protein
MLVVRYGPEGSNPLRTLPLSISVAASTLSAATTGLDCGGKGGGGRARSQHLRPETQAPARLRGQREHGPQRWLVASTRVAAARCSRLPCPRGTHIGRVGTRHVHFKEGDGVVANAERLADVRDVAVLRRDVCRHRLSGRRLTGICCCGADDSGDACSQVELALAAHCSDALTTLPAWLCSQLAGRCTTPCASVPLVPARATCIGLGVQHVARL